MNRRNIQPSKSYKKVKPSFTYTPQNWLFLKNSRSPKLKKEQTYLQKAMYSPQTFKGETEQVFTNTLISFTPQERHLMDIAQDNMLRNIDLMSGGESRIDIAKSIHTLSTLNLKRERELAEENERRMEEEKYKVIDKDELFSSRNESYPDVEMDIKPSVDESAAHFLTEMSEDQIRVLEKDKEHMKELILNSIVPSKESLKSISPYSFGSELNEGQAKVKQAFKQACCTQNERSVKPTLDNFPDPVHMDTFALKKMKLAGRL
jgi:hypothetical protein